MSAGAPTLNVPPANAKYLCRRDGHFFNHLGKRQVAGLDQMGHDKAERGFQTQHSKWGQGKLLLFFMRRMGRVVSRDGI